nr:hypothetical protein [Tanacetum cinerariifolium]
MTDATTPTGQALTMAPPVHSNDQSLPRIRWVQTRYLKFTAKGTKREVFRMPIPGSLITADLREASYYQEYLANVVKHRWFLSDEPARKPNPTSQQVRINILQYLIHLCMCKDVPTKMMKIFLLVENLRRQNPDNRKRAVNSLRVCFILPSSAAGEVTLGAESRGKVEDLAMVALVTVGMGIGVVGKDGSGIEEVV